MPTLLLLLVGLLSIPIDVHRLWADWDRETEKLSVTYSYDAPDCWGERLTVLVEYGSLPAIVDIREIDNDGAETTYKIDVPLTEEGSTVDGEHRDYYLGNEAMLVLRAFCGEEDEIHKETRIVRIK
jgi:hypothetical protein